MAFTNSLRPVLFGNQPILGRLLPLRSFHASARALDAADAGAVTPAPDASYDPREREIHIKLAKALEPTILRVQDISGGCGAQYAIEIASKRFAGLTMLKQHRLVNEVLQEDIKQWHALRLSTTAVKE